jgi:hypothetical protein
MKKIFLFLSSIVLFALIGCNDKKSNSKVVIKPINQEISTISYDQAVNLYGKPISTEVFDNANENEVFPGIRAGIAKYYKAGEKVKIKEAIWPKNDSIYTAVWYTEKENKWLPFDSFEYGAAVDF